MDKIMALFLGFHTNYNSLGTTIIGMNIFSFNG